jgi:23S rRNA (guanosine2251-2'-O)-methyltransferase
LKEWITGRNPVFEVLNAQRRDIFRLLIAEGNQPDSRLLAAEKQVRSLGLPVEKVPRTRLNNLSENHQGVALEVSAYPYSDLSAMFELAEKRNEPPFFLILDTLQNPQNFGTLLRSAEAFGVHGVMIPFRHTVDVTPAVVTASAGASEHLLVGMANLAQTIDQIKSENVWVLGLEGAEESVSVEATRLDGSIALVVGGESEGMRALTRKSCDQIIKLGMSGRIESLNAAVAGSIALYLAYQKRHPELFSGIKR